MNIQPDFKHFQRLAKRGNTIPIVVDLPADLETPVSVFLKLAHQKKHAFLLESVELGERLGRFSFIGMDPDVILEYQGDMFAHPGMTDLAISLTGKLQFSTGRLI